MPGLFSYRKFSFSTINSHNFLKISLKLIPINYFVMMIGDEKN